MAALVQHAAASGFIGTVTLPGAPTAGNLLVLNIGATEGAFTVPGFDLRRRTTRAFKGHDRILEVWTRTVQVGDDAAYDLGGTATIVTDISEWSGVTYDTCATGAATENVTVSATISPTNVGAPAVIYGANMSMDNDTPGVTALAWTGGYTELFEAALDNPMHGAAYQVVASAAASYTVDVTASGAFTPGETAAADTILLVLGGTIPPIVPKVTFSTGAVEFDSLLEQRIRVEFNAAGSGFFAISKDDPQATAANLARGNIIACTFPEIDPDPIFEFILEEGDFDLVSTDEEGGEELRFGGPGTLTYLRRAVLDYVEYEDGIGTVKKAKGKWVFSESNTEGHIINKMIREAQSASRPADPIGLLTKTFNSTTDSDGVAWADQTLEGKWREKIGTNLYDAVMRLVRAGLLSIEMAPGMVLNAYRSRGRNLTGTAFGAGVVRFVAGVNIVDELARNMAGITFASHAVIRYDDGSWTRATKDGGTPYDQETFLEVEAEHKETAKRIAKNHMKLREEAQEALIFAHRVPWPGDATDEASGIYLPGPSWTDNGLYWVGDLVTLHTGTGDFDYDNATKRVYAITLSADETGYLAPPIVELNAPYVRGASRGGSSTPETLGGGGGGGGGGSTADDTALFSLWKEPVRVCATTDVTIASGLNAGDTVDGVTLAAGDRVLLTGQTAPAENGIYSAGTAPSRTSDFDDGDELPGAMVYVVAGTANGGTVWRNTNTSEPVIDTDAITWALAAEPVADAHIADTSDAHDASAISIADAGGYFVGTDVEAALQELGAEPLNNFAATAAPAVTDDSGDGYGVGSRWVDTVADKEYVCTDPTVGAAVWVETTSSGSAGALDDLTDVNAPTPADQDVLTWDDYLGTWVAQAPAGGTLSDATPVADGGAGDAGVGTEGSRDDHQHPGDVVAIVAVIDGGGSAITTGVKLYLPVPFACTITANRALADQTGDIVVDVWADTYANYPPTDADSITAAAPITISSGVASEDTTLTGWTTSVAAGDVLGFNVDSVTDIELLTITLTATRT